MNNENALQERQIKRYIKNIGKIALQETTMILFGNGRKQGIIQLAIVGFYNQAIKAFYDDYTPLRYKRTYNTYSAIRRIWELESVNKTPTYTVGSVVNGEFIHSNNGKLNNGLYQNTSGRGGSWKPVNFNNERIIKYKKSSKTYHATYRFGVSGTQWVFDRTFHEGIHGFSKDDPWVNESNKSIYMRLAYERGHIPHKMNPTPKQLMDKMFEDYKDHKLYKIIQDTYLSSINHAIENYKMK